MMMVDGRRRPYGMQLIGGHYAAIVFWDGTRYHVIETYAIGKQNERSARGKCVLYNNLWRQGNREMLDKFGAWVA